jgi:hypothetical protein
MEVLSQERSERERCIAGSSEGSALYTMTP